MVHNLNKITRILTKQNHKFLNCKLHHWAVGLRMKPLKCPWMTSLWIEQTLTYMYNRFLLNTENLTILSTRNRKLCSYYFDLQKLIAVEWFMSWGYLFHSLFIVWYCFRYHKALHNKYTLSHTLTHNRLYQTK